VKNVEYFTQYTDILREELIPAMGCTEPIAIAYAAAKAREILGENPEEVTIDVSGNILKNVKSVVVPNTEGLRGIPAAVAVGIIAGNPDKELEVLSEITGEQIAKTKKFLTNTPITVNFADTPHIFDIMITLKKGGNSSFVRIVEHHTNIVCIKKNDEILFSKEIVKEENGLTDYSILNIKDIIYFADNISLDCVSEILNRQIEYNMAIAEEGLKNSYGANIGSTLLSQNSTDIHQKMRAYAAAGSDARMNGCEMPVIIC